VLRQYSDGDAIITPTSKSLAERNVRRTDDADDSIAHEGKLRTAYCELAAGVSNREHR
jgi:hypothetical protein